MRKCKILEKYKIQFHDNEYHMVGTHYIAFKYIIYGNDDIEFTLYEHSHDYILYLSWEVSH